ncbi:MAG TPA: hypothetical protein RWO66_09570 [Ruminococcus sp.]
MQFPALGIYRIGIYAKAETENTDISTGNNKFYIAVQKSIQIGLSA